MTAAAPWLAAALLLASQSADDAVGARLLDEGRYAQALDHFDARLAEAGESAATHAGRARALTGLLDYPGAAAALERAAAIDPGDGATWALLVRLLPQAGRKHDAPAAFERWRAIEPHVDRAGVASALRRAGFSSLARAALGDRETLSPAERAELGLIAADEGDFAEAVRQLEDAAPSASRAEIHEALGRAFEGLGWRERAEASYRDALAADPRDRTARFRLGRLLQRAGRATEAAPYLDGYETYRQWERRVKLLTLMVGSGTLEPAEDRVKSLELVTLLLQGGVVDDAGTVVAAALGRHPGDAALLVARARWLAAIGRPDRAREALRPLLAGPGPPLDALWLAGRLELGGGGAAAAIPLLEQVRDRDAEVPALLLKELATAYALAGRIQDAEAAFRQAVSRDPARADVQVDLAQVLEASGRFAEAEAHFRRAVALDPRFATAHLNLAASLRRAARPAEAIAALEAGVAALPGDATLRRALADALRAAGRRDDAAAQERIAERLEAGRP